MMIGPEPIIITFLTSERLGIGLLSFMFKQSFYNTNKFWRSKLQQISPAVKQENVRFESRPPKERRDLKLETGRCTLHLPYWRIQTRYSISHPVGLLRDISSLKCDVSYSTYGIIGRKKGFCSIKNTVRRRNAQNPHKME